jgi:hypothetical protein
MNMRADPSVNARQLNTESKISHKNGRIAHNCDDCLFFPGLRKSIGYKGLTLNQLHFDGDSINS